MTVSPIFCFIGPTASGKSQLALNWAQKKTSQIVSCDSVAVYKECQIGSARPSYQELQSVPHHLIATHSLKDPQLFNVKEFISYTTQIISVLQKKKTQTIICGGSYFYLYHLYEGLNEIPKRNSYISHYLERFSTHYLYETLTDIDPSSTQNINPKNRRRLIRAIEVFINSGHLFSHFFKKKGGLSNIYPFVFICPYWPKEVLLKRMKTRLQNMMNRGWIEEVQFLSKDPLVKSRLKKFIGYKEILEFLEGQLSKEKRDEKIMTQNWHLAKRQYTWIKRNNTVQWLECEEGETHQSFENKLKKIVSCYE